MLELYEYVLFLGDEPAIVALEKQGFLAVDVEFGLDGFVAVADAGGVGAFYDVFDHFGQFDFLLLHDLVVSDDVDARMWGEQCDFGDLLRLQFAAFDLHDVFCLQQLAGHVDRDRDGSFFFSCYSKYSYDIERVAGCDVVDHCSVLDF